MIPIDTIVSIKSGDEYDPPRCRHDADVPDWL